MNSIGYSRTYSNRNEAIEDVIELFKSNLPNYDLSIVASYQEKIFSFEHIYKFDDKIKELIEEKLKIPTQENVSWVRANSKPTLTYNRLKAIKMDEEEFIKLQKQIVETGIIISEAIMECKI